MRRIHLVIPGLAMILAAVPAGAQQPADRAALAAFRARLASLDSAGLDQEARGLSDSNTGSDPISRLQAGYVRLYHGRLRQDRDELVAALEQFTRVVGSRRDWPDAWLGVGLARIALAERHALAHPGPLQLVGMSYREGAERALVQALALDSTFLEAARALGGPPVLRPSERPSGPALEALRRATAGKDEDPALLLGRARRESVAGHPDSAIAVLERYLAAGGDSGVGCYRLARELFRVGESVPAVTTYFRGADLTADDDSAAALYFQDVAWVASPEELDQWDSLPRADRPAWLHRFWDRRDVADGQPRGARLTEHYRRYEYALAHFAITPPGSGNPGIVGRGSSADDLAADDGSGSTQSSTADGGGAPADASWGVVFGASSPFREYRRRQNLVDDRGVIYIRHGPPDKLAFYVGGPTTPPNLSWKYTRPDGDLVFHFLHADFLGNAGPNTLVASLVGLGPEMLEARCGLDSRLCLLGMRAATGNPAPPEWAVQERQRGRATIRLGTTSDEDPRRFHKPLDALLQVHGLFGPPLAADLGRLLVEFAAPGDRLHPLAGSGPAEYRLRLQVMAYDDATGRRFDLDTVRTFQADHRLHRGEFLTGLTELPVPAGGYLVTVTVSEGDTAFGSARRVDPVQVPVVGDTLVLSDILLGRQGSGLAWQADGFAVPLNPLNAFDRSDLVQLYCAVTGLVPGAQYEVQLSIAPPNAPLSPVLKLQFQDQAQNREQVIQRELDIHALRPGHYLLSLVLSSAAGDRVADRSVMLNISK